MTHRSRRHRWSLPLRGVLPVLLAVAVLGGSLEFHGDHPLVGAGSLAFSSGGCHPELATHFEPAPDVTPRECPACLSRLRLRGGHLAPQILAVVEPLPLFSLGESREKTLATPRCSVSTRGPPNSFA